MENVRAIFSIVAVEILIHVNEQGAQAARDYYLKTVKPMSREQRKLNAIFANLEQDTAGKWYFR